VKLKNKTLAHWLLAAFLLGGTPAAQAQWLTQNIDLKSGWNAIFVHVDASYNTLNASVAGDTNNPIIEIWRWNPPSATQFIDSPAEPTAAP